MQLLFTLPGSDSSFILSSPVLYKHQLLSFSSGNIFALSIYNNGFQQFFSTQKNQIFSLFLINGHKGGLIIELIVILYHTLKSSILTERFLADSSYVGRL